MKIAVTGSRGRLGSELVKRGCIPIQGNLTYQIELDSQLKNITPDVIIHCAAYTDVDGCESAPHLAANTNTGCTYNLRQAFDGKIIYISTDYIFDGANGPYREFDKPNPISIYGWSKLGGELVLRKCIDPNPNSIYDWSKFAGEMSVKDECDLVVRTTCLYDHDSNNFATAIIKSLWRGESPRVPDSLQGNPTYIPHLAEGILKAIELDLSGIINIAGSRIISRFEFARHLARKACSDEYRVKAGLVMGKAPRPLRGGLITEKAQSLGIPIYSMSEGIEELFDALETVEAG